MENFENSYRKNFSNQEESLSPEHETQLWDSIVEELGPTDSIVAVDRLGILKRWGLPFVSVALILFLAMLPQSRSEEFTDESSSGYAVDFDKSLASTIESTEDITNLVDDISSTPSLQEKKNLVEKNESDDATAIEADNITEATLVFSTLGEERTISDNKSTQQSLEAKRQSGSSSGLVNDSKPTSYDFSREQKSLDFISPEDNLIQESVNESEEHIAEIDTEDFSTEPFGTSINSTSINNTNTNTTNASSSSANSTANSNSANRSKIEYTTDDSARSTSLGIEASQSQIEFSSISSPELALLSRKTANFDPILEKTLKAKGNLSYEVGINSALNRSSLNYNGSNSDLATRKNNTEQGYYGYSAGIDLAAVYKNKWIFNTGLAYEVQQTIYDESITRIIAIERDLTTGILVNQVNYEVLDEFEFDSTYSYSSVNRIKQVNSFSSLSIPVLVGWKSPTTSFSYGILVGANIRIRTGQTGKLISSSGELSTLQSASDLFYNAINIGVSTSPFVRYNFSANCSIQLSYLLSAYRPSVSTDQSVRLTNYTHAALIGFRYRL